MAQANLNSVQSSLVRLFTAGTMTGMSESQLLDRFFAHGDSSAFEAILHRHGPMVLAVCRRILIDPNDVDDAFQATFYVLVKKGQSIRNQAVLGTWLHGVARRVAVRGRTSSRRRQARERGGLELTAWEDRRGADADAAELRAMIDEEVTRLPERYRSALVLCDLEGQTHEQAAAQLRCPVGTVKSRLARGRDKLRSRLTRRGLAPSAAILASALAPEPASAMTGALQTSTLSTAIRLLISRDLAAGAVPAAIATLVHETVRSMSMSALKLATAVLMAAGVVVTGAGVFAYQVESKKAAENLPATQSRNDGPEKKAAENLPAIDPEKASAARPTLAIESLAQARYSIASKAVEEFRTEHNRNPQMSILVELHSWALKSLEASRDLTNTRANRIDALEKYLKVMTEAEKVAREHKNADSPEAAEYFRLEAELWLAQARAGKEPSIPGRGHGDRPGNGKTVRPGTDPKSQALLARLEETIPMKFSNPTPLEEVLKYIQSATAGTNGQAIPIYVDPVDFSGSEENINIHEKIMQTPITMDLEGVPLRRVLKLIAEQLQMGYGISDGMVTMRPPNFLRRNWQELLVMEESFPESSPLATEVERARRGELTAAELEDLSKRLEAIEAVTKRYASIRMLRPAPQMNVPNNTTAGSPARPAAPAR